MATQWAQPVSKWHLVQKSQHLRAGYKCLGGETFPLLFSQSKLSWLLNQYSNFHCRRINPIADFLQGERVNSMSLCSPEQGFKWAHMELDKRWMDKGPGSAIVISRAKKQLVIPRSPSAHPDKWNLYWLLHNYKIGIFILLSRKTMPNETSQFTSLIWPFF